MRPPERDRRIKLDIKYTSDGRKVIIVGKLNSEQSIVQEIFVCDGQEVPSGENFVVSSLHDAPAESWKEKNLRELEERYEKTKKNIEGRMDLMQKRMSLAESKAKYRANALLAFAENSDNEQLQLLHAFLGGEITHFFVDSYPPEIVTWDDDENYDVDSWSGRINVDGMKLVSIFGISEGKLDYRIHQYRDGSGGGLKKIVPCTSREAALAEAQKVLDLRAELYVSGATRSLNIDGWLKIDGIKIPIDALNKHNKAKHENQLARIEKLRAEIAALEAESTAGDRQ